MTLDLDQECSRLIQSTIASLRQRYAEVFGESPPRTGNKTCLIRRILWRLQALAEGDLSERARRRAAELANDADLRLIPPRPPGAPALPSHDRPTDPRLPRPGTTLVRRYKNQLHEVTVLASGFAYQEIHYGSLSAVAKAITGCHCNGFLFFRLLDQGKRHGQVH